MTALRVGTRASTLARTQSGMVAELIAEALGCEVELVEITTEGDTSKASLASMGGVGVFVSALRDALLDDRIDVAVHSLKDLPVGPFPGITLAAVPAREDVRDVIIARDGLTLGELPVGSRIGTGSPRRAAQLAALGLGHVITDIRGNVDTRINKVTSGEYDAVVLARAGLARLGRLAEITEVLDPIQVMPAAGQGALAIECRTSDAELVTSLSVLEDFATRAAVDAERGVLAGLEAGCAAPVGVIGEIVEGDHGDELWVRAVVMSADGTLAVRASLTGAPDDAHGVGAALAALLLDEGAAQVMDTAMEEQHA